MFQVMTESQWSRYRTIFPKSPGMRNERRAKTSFEISGNNSCEFVWNLKEASARNFCARDAEEMLQILLPWEWRKRSQFLRDNCEQLLHHYPEDLLCNSAVMQS